MDDGICKLITKLCESFLTDHNIDKKYNKRLWRIAYMELLRHHHSQVSHGNTLKEVLILLQVELMTISLKRIDWDIYDKQYLLECLEDLQHLCEKSDYNETLVSVFLFLFHMSRLNSHDSQASFPVNEVETGDCFERRIQLFSKINKLRKPPTQLSYVLFDWNQFENVSPISKYSSDPFELSSRGTYNITLIENDNTDDHYTSLDRFSKQKTFSYSESILSVPPLEDSVYIPTQDEGFVTPGSEFNRKSEENNTINWCEIARNNEYNINTLRRNWDYLGSYDPPREPYFASEVPESILHLWKLAHLNCKNNLHFLMLGVTVSELIRDVRFLLYGISSQSFLYIKETNTFQTRDGLYIKTLTPELLLDYCEDFTRCANYYIALKCFVKNESLKYSRGVVFQTFCKCLLNSLHVYESCLAGFEWDRCSLTSLLKHVTQLSSKLLFLIDLCFITIGKSNDTRILPNGAFLLDYLYSYTRKVMNTDLTFLLCYMFKECCNSYFILLSEWLFDGKCDDRYNELFISINWQNERLKDRRWLDTFTLNAKLIPEFLHDFSNDIYICGKFVALLKICCPQESVCRIFIEGHPKIKCVFSKDQIDKYVVDWKNFEDNYSSVAESPVNIADILMVRTPDQKYYENIEQIHQAWFEEYERNKQKYEQEKSDKLHRLHQIRRKSIDDFIQQKLEYEETNAKLEEELINNFKTDEEEKENDACTQRKYLESIYVLKNESSNLRMQIAEWKMKRLNLNNERNQFLKEDFRTLSIELDRTGLMKTKPTHVDSYSIGGGGDVLCYKLENVENKPVTEKVSGNNGNNENLASGDNNNVLRGSGDADTNKFEEKSAFQSDPYYSNYNVALENKQNIMVSQFSLAPANELEDSGKRVDGMRLENEVEEIIPRLRQVEANVNKRRVMSSQFDLKPNNDTISSRKILRHDENKNRCKMMMSTINRKSYVRMADGPVIETEAMRNKRRTMSSTFGMEVPKLKLNFVKSDEQRNKCKVMSSNFCFTEKFDNVIMNNQGPETEAMRNKRKIMSSEFGLPLPDHVQQVNESEMQQNKTKAMSSVLQNSYDEPRVIKTISDEALKNKLKVMSSEYHMQLEDNVVESIKVSSDSELLNFEECEAQLDTGMSGKSSPEQDAQVVDCNSVDDIESCTSCDNFITALQTHFQNPVLKSSACSSFDKLFSSRMDMFVEPQSDSQLTDVDIITMPRYLQLSICIPLRIQLKLVNDSILKLFIKKTSFLTHLMRFKDYFFLQKPEFSLSLKNHLFIQLDNFNGCFSVNDFNFNYTLQAVTLNIDNKLSLDFVDYIDSSVNLKVNQILQQLTLHYSTHWPLNILITDDMVKDYNSVFKLVVSIYWISWILQQDFCALKNLREGRGQQYREIQIYRHVMTQVIRTFQRYIEYDVVNSCWKELIEKLTKNQINLDFLYDCHKQYLQTILYRLWLCSSSNFSASLSDLLSYVVEYHAALKAGTWNSNKQVNLPYHSNYKTLQEIYIKFMNKMKELKYELKGLIRDNRCTHLKPLYGNLFSNLIV